MGSSFVDQTQVIIQCLSLGVCYGLKVLFMHLSVLKHLGFTLRGVRKSEVHICFPFSDIAVNFVQSKIIYNWHFKVLLWHQRLMLKLYPLLIVR